MDTASLPKEKKSKNFGLYGQGIVGSLFGDLNVVGMALFQAGTGDPDKLGFLVEFRDSGTAGVTHAGAQAAQHLVYTVRQRPLVRNAALDPFGNQFFRVGLEVAVGAALIHGA